MEGPGVDPKRMVAIAFVAGASLLGIFLQKVVALALSYTRWEDFPVFGEEFTISTAAGFGVAAAAAVVAWRSQKPRAVSLEISAELKKVTWPSLRETRAATVAVIAATFVAAAILGLFDYVWAWLSARIY